MIVFKTVRWKNFLSTGNDFLEFGFENKTTLVVGDNGAGKSTILDAVIFALFGKPYRNITKAKLVNTINNKNCLVEIEFRIGKYDFMVRRGLKPSVFEIYQDEVLINKPGSTKDYQAELEKSILKLNEKSFRQIVILGSADFVPFMKLSTGHRREVTEELLDLKTFTIMNGLLKKRIDEAQAEEIEARGKLESARSRLRSALEHEEKLRLKDEKLIESYLVRKQELVLEAEGVVSEMASSEEVLRGLIERQNSMSSVTFKARELQKLESQIKGKISSLRDEEKFLQDHQDCPTCEQHIDEQFRSSKLLDISVEIREAEEALEKMRKVQEETQAKVDELNSIKSSIDKESVRENLLRTRLKNLQTSISRIDLDIKEASSELEHSDPTGIQEIELEVEKFRKESVVADIKLRTLGYAGVMLKDGGIKSEIIAKFIPVLNGLINKYLSAMDFFVQFELDEQFEETIKSRYRDDFSYASFSEGEKFRINLAILFAWRAISKMRNSVNTNLLIMDEVMDSSLDSNGTEEFLKILFQLTPDNNVVIISHKTDQISDKFDHVILFEKVSNFSRMVR